MKNIAEKGAYDIYKNEVEHFDCVTSFSEKNYTAPTKCKSKTLMREDQRWLRIDGSCFPAMYTNHYGSNHCNAANQAR